MEAAFALGARFNFATPDEVERIVNTGNEGLFQRIHMNRRTNYRRLIGSHNTASSTGTFAISLGKPAGGMQWNLCEIIVTGATDREAPAGAVAAVYCGGEPYMPTPTTVFQTPPLGQLVRPALALPAVFQFGAREPWPIKEGETLSIIIYSATTAMTSMSAVATVSEVNSASFAMNVL